ncbi:MAG TPA: ATP-binding protein [Methylibium sp.]
MTTARLAAEPSQQAELPIGQQPELPDHVRNLYTYTPSSLVGNAIGAAVLVLLFAGAQPGLVSLWSAAFTVAWVYRAWLAWRFSAVGDQPDTDFVLWQVRWNIGTLASGLLWGVAGWLFYNSGDAIQQIALIIIIYSYCVASVSVLADQKRVFIAFLLLNLVPTIARIAREGSVYSYELVGVLCLAMAMTALLGRNYRQALERVIELKVRTEQLLRQLRVEKQAADEARREAEVANRAKTQFFAAASHDLRQPLHALGLFAEALRQKSRGDGEVSQLVNSINSSVDALEGLFSELLDITRIDTGGVEVQAENFSIRDLFARLRLAFEPTAFEKGLALDFRGEARYGHADPLLVERILRNLVSNAIRYTEDGGVLVSCRNRGDQLCLQVWDTGIGIAEKEQPRIFEEFYQVHSAKPLEPHHRKGLGLGLAIVKRLANLMGAPLTVRSQPGRGTVFTLLVTMGKPPRATGTVPSTKGPLGLTLTHRLIVVIEDEPAVREALEVLLKGWGASVVSFDTVEATRGWAELQDASLIKPDLMLVDYRLPGGSTGIDAITVLRQRFGPVPAIMITGSTMTGHEDDAQRHDFHVLIKPVVPNKLRAMIGFKLGVR